MNSCRVRDTSLSLFSFAFEETRPLSLDIDSRSIRRLFPSRETTAELIRPRHAIVRIAIVRKSKWNRGRRKRKTKRIQSRFYFSLPLEEMLNFTVKFNESMDRFGWKTGGWVSRKQPPTNFFSSFVPQGRGYPNRSLFTTIFRGTLAFQVFSRSFVRAGRLPRDTWPPPDLPRFTPLAELKATEKIKGENRRNLLAVQFLRDRGLKIRLDPSPSFSSPSPSIVVFSTVFRSLSSARFAVSFLEADDSIPPSR